jgi:integrase
MAHAVASDPGLVPGLAFMLFAGVRPSEVERLAWPAAAAGDGLVIGSSESKTRRRRLVPILAPLRAFLEAFPPPEGPLLPVNRSERLKAIRRECGVKWGHDIMRHSFVLTRSRSTGPRKSPCGRGIRKPSCSLTIGSW